MSHQHMIESLEAQLSALNAERQRLQTEIGCSDAKGIITMVRSMESQLCALYEQNHVHDLEEQLGQHYLELTLLQDELGCSDADSVINMIRSLEAQLCALYKQGAGSTQPTIDSVPVGQQTENLSDVLQSFKDRLSSLTHDMESRGSISPVVTAA